MPGGIKPIGKIIAASVLILDTGHNIIGGIIAQVNETVLPGMKGVGLLKVSVRDGFDRIAERALKVFGPGDFREQKCATDG